MLKFHLIFNFYENLFLSQLKKCAKILFLNLAIIVGEWVSIFIKELSNSYCMRRTGGRIEGEFNECPEMAGNLCSCVCLSVCKCVFTIYVCTSGSTCYVFIHTYINMHASMCIYVHYTVFTLCVAVLLVFLYFFICNIYPNGNMILYKQSNNKENRAANKGLKKNNYKGRL